MFQGADNKSFQEIYPYDIDFHADPDEVCDDCDDEYDAPVIICVLPACLLLPLP